LRRIINICSDSRAALAALTKTTTESSLVWEHMQVLGKLSEFNKVTLVWIPGHLGVPGNEEVHRLAKEVPPNQFTAIPFSVHTKTHHEAVGTEASGQVDCLY
jgi:ribonuclease HI